MTAGWAAPLSSLAQADTTTERVNELSRHFALDGISLR
jgi:hypothetical protein